MAATQTPVRIGIFGTDPSHKTPLNRHVDLWDVGYAGALTHSDAVPAEVCAPNSNRNWDDILEEIDGILFAGFGRDEFRHRIYGEDLCHWCREHKMPLLAIDNGMLMLNTTFGGTLYTDLPRELPEAIQHRQPPEDDVRHLIEILPNTHLCQTYGEGEIIVNSQHRSAIARLARGFRVSGQALDGVIEAIEWEDEDWFAMGIQWQPASATSSGLDIQVFRTLIDASHKYVAEGKAVEPQLARAA